jgi:hypothetical protein
MPDLSAADRAQLRSVLEAIDNARLSSRTAVRVYRNALLGASAVLLLVAVTFPFATAGMSLGIVIIRSGSPGSQPAVHSLLIAMTGVELWGLLGGVIAVIANLYRLRASRSPLGLQFAQMVLKLPAGALTALFGVVLLQSGILPPLSLAPNSKLAAYAIIFGFAQEALTHFVDRRASQLLSKSEPGDRAASA